MIINLYKFQEEDFDDYFRLVNNEKVMAQITERPISYKEAKINYQHVLERNQKFKDYGSYKIYDGLGKEFVGLGSLILNENQLSEAEIGYMILPEFWGQGYGKEIAGLLTEKAQKLELKQLKAVIDPNNIPSKKILTNLGFKTEKICILDGLPGEIMYKILA